MTPPPTPSPAGRAGASPTDLCDIGLVGLAVMGENLVLNMEDHGYSVAVFNRTVSKVDDFLARNPGKKLRGTRSLEEMTKALSKPRKVMLMVKAGPPVDEFIEHLLPHLEKGDVIIDGGNSHFHDTIRRTRELEARGLLFIGTGVSGGEEGARHGPSIMPGGSPAAWPLVKEIFQAIAAKVEGRHPCCDWVGKDGAGHYVKMVHNGIEYGDMQLICEAYFLMKESLGMSAQEMHETFAEWNRGELDSYLIEITRDIFARKDPSYRKAARRDDPRHRGTEGNGEVDIPSPRSTLACPPPTIVEAVPGQRDLGPKKERIEASKVLQGPDSRYRGQPKEFLKAIHDALYSSKICSYAQGFALMAAAAAEYKWDLNFGSIALLWRGGCIIRARFLERIKDAFDRDRGLKNLLLDPFFRDVIERNQTNWRLVVGQAAQLGVPAPAFGSALGYYDSYRRASLPANLLQAQRDYFGAHTYQRIDREGVFHTEWLPAKA